MKWFIHVVFQMSAVGPLTPKSGSKAGIAALRIWKHEPASDIDTGVVKSLKALDPERPIREATGQRTWWHFSCQTDGSTRPLRFIEPSSTRLPVFVLLQGSV